MWCVWVAQTEVGAALRNYLQRHVCTLQIGPTKSNECQEKAAAEDAKKKLVMDELSESNALCG